MVVVIFRSRLRNNVDMNKLEALGIQMYGLAAAMPGFISYKDFSSADGESLSLVEFNSEAELLRWRNHPEHIEAQELGRSQFFEEYHIQVCTLGNAYKFTPEQGRQNVV